MERTTEPVQIVQPIVIEKPVERVIYIHPQPPATPVIPETPGPKPPIWDVRRPEPEIEDEQAPTSSKRKFEQSPESKKDFEPVPISKKEFDPEPEIEDEPEFDDSDVGRWRFDWQVAELVIYRHEFGKWPEDVPVETGLRSYYELRYFDEGTNRKGIKYSELYAKHRAKRNLWISQYEANGQVEADLDTPTAESNVVHLPIRRTNSAG